MPNVQHNLYFDNFLTSTKLLSQLKYIDTKETGTIRENHVREGCKLPHSSILTKQPRECFGYLTVRRNEIVVCKSDDNSVVILVSNHSQVSKRKIFRKRKKIYIHTYMFHITNVRKYNSNKDGVDRTDQNISDTFP